MFCSPFSRCFYRCIDRHDMCAALREKSADSMVYESACHAVAQDRRPSHSEIGAIERRVLARTSRDKWHKSFRYCDRVSCARVEPF